MKFQPGQSGNPGGRPKRRPVTATILEEFQKLDDTSGEPVVRRLVRSMISEALNGNMTAARLLIERIEGPVPPDQIQQLEIEHRLSDPRVEFLNEHDQFWNLTGTSEHDIREALKRLTDQGIHYNGDHDHDPA